MTKKAKTTVIVLIVIMLAGFAALSVPLGIYVSRYSKGSDRIDSIYEKSYHETVTALGNAETKLSKLNVIQGKTVRRELLMDVWKECDIAVTNLTFLGTDSEDMEKTIKFINQLGDYSYYLCNKLTVSEINAEEKQNVNALYGLLKNLNSDLSKVGDNMISDDKVSAKTLSDFSAVAGTIKNYSSIDYPELIYDGPFSDGLDDRELKFLKGAKDVTEEQAYGILNERFGNVTDVKKISDTDSGIPSYVYSFKKSDRDCTAFITKKGGFVASYNGYVETGDPKISEDDCVRNAVDFCKSIGYENMAKVWVYNNNSTVYVNLAYKQNDIIYYPDLIKVKVSCDSGEVIGLEAQNFLYNHASRDISYDKSGENKITVGEELKVTSSAYCVIPVDGNAEVFTKEIVGTYDDLTYYLYFDLKTGEEIRALVVIDEEGEMLI